VTSFSVVMPTVGRPSLYAAIASVVDALEDSDELIVVGDGRQDFAADVVESFQPANIVYIEASMDGSRFGNAQRDAGMALARADWLCWLDDDDRHTFAALDIMRDAIDDSGAYHSAHIFKARWGPGHHWRGTLWAEPVVKASNFGTCQVVLPNRPYQRSWCDFNDRGLVSDYGFLSAAIGECDGVEWHDALVAVVRP